MAALPGSLRVVGVKWVGSDLDFQTHRGQIHHVRVWTVFKDCPSIQLYE